MGSLRVHSATSSWFPFSLWSSLVSFSSQLDEWKYLLCQAHHHDQDLNNCFYYLKDYLFYNKVRNTGNKLIDQWRKWRQFHPEIYLTSFDTSFWYFLTIGFESLFRLLSSSGLNLKLLYLNHDLIFSNHSLNTKHKVSLLQVNSWLEEIECTHSINIMNII